MSDPIEIPQFPELPDFVIPNIPLLDSVINYPPIILGTPILTPEELSDFEFWIKGENHDG